MKFRHLYGTSSTRARARVAVKSWWWSELRACWAARLGWGGLPFAVGRPEVLSPPPNNSGCGCRCGCGCGRWSGAKLLGQAHAHQKRCTITPAVLCLMRAAGGEIRDSRFEIRDIFQCPRFTCRSTREAVGGYRDTSLIHRPNDCRDQDKALTDPRRKAPQRKISERFGTEKIS